MGWELDPHMQRGQGYSQFLGISAGLPLPPGRLPTGRLHHGSRLFPPTRRHGTGFRSEKACAGQASGKAPSGGGEPEGKETPAQHRPGTAPGLGWDAERLGSWESQEQRQVPKCKRHLGAGHRSLASGGDRTFSVPQMRTLRPGEGRPVRWGAVCGGPSWSIVCDGLVPGLSFSPCAVSVAGTPQKALEKVPGAARPRPTLAGFHLQNQPQCLPCVWRQPWRWAGPEVWQHTWLPWHRKEVSATQLPAGTDGSWPHA